MLSRSLTLVVCLLPLFACGSLGSAGSTSTVNLAADRLALEGYDPVAYFEEGGGEPRVGTSELWAELHGALYRFSSSTNRDLFLANPDRYEPRYGGWCAWAMVDGERVEIDPESFLIEDGGLYLFYDGLFGDTRKLWLEKGGANLRPAADREWNNIIGKQTGAK